MKTIIILGGGVGGIVTANELGGRLSVEHKIILIEKNSEHTFAPSYLWLMNGDRKKNQIKVPLKSLLNNNMEVVNATIDGIFPAEKKVTAGGKDLRGMACPMNFVKTKIELAQMKAGETLEILLDEGAPIQNVPGSVRSEGHKIIKEEKVNDYWTVLINLIVNQLKNTKTILDESLKQLYLNLKLTAQNSF